MFYYKVIKNITVILMVLVFGMTMQAHSKMADIHFKTDQGIATITAEVAETDEEHATGLMNRTVLPEKAGMLFVFNPPQETAFWMKNTPLPLDLLFIDSNKSVVNVYENAVPYSLTPMEVKIPVQWVLEVNAGQAKKMTYQGEYVITDIVLKESH